MLEFGSGNLRNSLFLLKRLPRAELFACELPRTMERFRDAYLQFEKKKGHIVDARKLGSRRFDTVVCTFVLETVCPRERRLSMLGAIRRSMKEKGALVASFRGYPGVRGTNYGECPLGEGLITPLKTFVAPSSLAEVDGLLREAGFGSVEWLQKYRVQEPENIHVLARGGP